MLRPFFVVACSALSLTLVAGCTQPIDDGHDRSDTSALRRLDPPAVHSGPRYNAYVQAVGCASINGTGGTWTASATFPGDRAFCAYHWSGAAVADTSTLFSTLLAAGVADDLIVRDIACELASQGRPSSSLWSGGGQEETTCGRPVVVDVWIDGDGGGGSMSWAGAPRTSSRAGCLRFESCFRALASRRAPWIGNARKRRCSPRPAHGSAPRRPIAAEDPPSETYVKSDDGAGACAVAPFRARRAGSGRERPERCPVPVGVGSGERALRVAERRHE
jgi:hypothetical protein